MILIDVLIPQTGEVYDFEISKCVGLKELLLSVLSLIEENSHVRFIEAKRSIFVLRSAEFLSDEKSVYEQGVRNGDRLIVV